MDDKEDTLEDASLIQGAYGNVNELFQHLDDPNHESSNFSPNSRGNQRPSSLKSNSFYRKQAGNVAT